MSQIGVVAAALNRELTTLLREAGTMFGFEAVVEYPVRGGRLDVVWTWSPDLAFPGLSEPVPLIGFEIESSWRTRKHVKGDLLNLQDAGVGLGVIVLAGTDAKDDGLRRFAETLVDRPGPRVLIWTADDVRALASRSALKSESASRTSAPMPSVAIESPIAPSPTLAPHPVVGHTGKYAPLYRWLQAQDTEALAMKFAAVEEAMGMPLPSSCRNHVPHWHSYEGSAVARAIIDAGWKATHVSLSLEMVTFVRTSEN